MRTLICGLIFFLFSENAIFGQKNGETEYDTSSIFSKVPIKIVAHTDSSLFMLGKKAYEKRKFDLYISKHTAYKKSIDFDTCLNFSKLFSEDFNPDNFRYSTFQCNDKIVIIFDAIIGDKKTVIAKTIDYKGKVSEALVLDESDLSNTNLKECKYFYSLTTKNEILITLRRTYKSGYQRDKCILYDSRLSKLWDYELPKINSHIDVNLIAYVYNSNQLIYHVAEGALDSRGNEWIFKEYADTIIKKDVDGLKYDLKICKDSLDLLIAYPLEKEIKIVKVYWPFRRFPIITPISSSQIILYSLVDIDDEKYMLPGKKAVFYKRIDIKNNIELYEKLIPLDKRTQDNLTYQSGAPTNGPTTKNFGLVSEKMIDGKLFSLFTHNVFEESELITSCFDISKNKLEWIQLIPRKLATSSSLDALTFSYSDKKIHIGLYENKQNFETPLNLYRHAKHKMARNYDGSNFIEVRIEENGNMSKSIVNETSEVFLFPWLSLSVDNATSHFFESRFFLPIGFLYK